MSKDIRTSVIPEEISALLESRATYQEWLQRLDDVGERYRSEVAERVRGDYEKRLAGVAEELENHRSDIESSLRDRRSEMEDLSKRFDDQSAELEEAELRFQVGEYDEDAWEDRREELTGGLEDIDVGLRGARKAVAELEGVLAELSGKPGVPVRDEPLPGPSAVAGSLTSTPEADKPDWQRGESAGRTRLSASQDVALEPDRTADGEATDPVAEDIEVADAEEARSEDSSEEFSDELAFLESLSLDDTETFDAVSRLLDEEEDR